MSVRKTSVKLGTAAAAVTALALAALAPAGAATTEDSWYQLSNSGFANGTDFSSTAILGAGSDTIQFVDGAIAKQYDADNATANQLVSLAACKQPTGTNTVQTSCTYPEVSPQEAYPFTVAGTALATNEAEGTSGDGANLLSDNGSTDTKFAFSRASGLKTTGTNAGLDAFPFALDQVVAVVSNKVKSNAPSTITLGELYGIYSGIYTNWDQLGGKNAPIHAYYPFNSSSGTLGAFYGALDTQSPEGSSAGLGVIVPSAGTPKASGSFVSNVAVNDSSLVASGEAGGDIVEHDPAAIENDPDAVAPFSYSRIIMDESTPGDPGSSPIKALGGWVLDRAVYNEVRDANANATILQGVDPDWIANYDYSKLDASAWPSVKSDGSGNIVKTLFGASGYFCGSKAATIMEKYGFYQLDAGICGVPVTTSAPSSLAAVGAPTVSKTTATVSGSSVSVSVASGDSTVTSTPSGKVSVTFVPFNTTPGGAKAAPAVTAKLSNGTVTVSAPAKVLAGQWQAAVAYEGDSTFQASWSDGIPTGSSTPATVTVTKGKLSATAKRSGKKEVVSISYPHVAGKATVSRGGKVLAHASITGTGKVAIPAAKVKKGQKLTVKIGGKSVKVTAK
jgi:hypothetical protein